MGTGLVPRSAACAPWMLGLALAWCPLTFLAADVERPEAVAPGQLEGRPAPEHVSTLQARVDAATPGATLVIEAGRYDGDLVLDKPVRLIGRGRPLLVGSGTGSVVRVRVADVTVEGFDIDGQGGGDLGRDPAGVHVSAARATVRDCRIRRTLFGVYLREADGAVVEGCAIRGIPGKDAGEKGSGIHVYDTRGFRCLDNDIRDVRDGFYIQSSYDGLVKGNRARDLRYGLHYMFSDDNVFEDNLFENGAAGTALMYSRRITFRRNRFLHNRGYASAGLLFKTCDDVLAEDNLIADNARGIFLEGSYRNVFRRNVVAGSDAAIVLFGSAGQNRFLGNSFVGNLTPLQLEGPRTDTVFSGNYWSGDDAPDLDGDGRSDRPYRLANVFDHLRGNLLAADLMSDSFAARALAAAESAFPVLRQLEVQDDVPLAHPPELPDVPRASTAGGRVSAAGLTVSLALLGLGALVLVRGRNPGGAR